MTASYPLASHRTPTGARIDRTASISFTFDGKRYQGCRGDTLASALIANGVHLIGRSFKYHRPRGILAAGSEEPNALVTVTRGDGRSTPNLRATQVELYEGLVADSQNRWPSLGFDAGAINDKLPSGLISAGFYYKTFMGPGRAWAKLYEPAIRRAAGLGVAPTTADTDHYSHRYAHCEVLIIGAGAAGLAAALSASEGKVRVILCDEQAEFGGGLLSERVATIDGLAADAWRQRAVETLRARPNVRMLTRTQAFGYYAQNFVALAERVTDHLASPAQALPRERLWKVRAGHVILATGAFERPLVFPDNDRPGIMLAAAAQTYAVRYGARPGRRAVVFTADDTGYAAARDLHMAGIDIAAIADLRASADGPAARAALAAGLAVLPQTAVIATEGRLRVSAVQLGHVRAGGVTPTARFDCDLVCMAGGWTPNINLFSQSRGKLRFDEARGVFLPDTPAEAQASVGACNGTTSLEAALIEGAMAGARAIGWSTDRAHHVAGDTPFMGGYHGAVPHPADARKVKAFVDFQNDVTAKDIVLAVQEGFHSIEHVKRYTTTGMATDQGKTSNMNALAIAAGALDKPIPQIGLTTFRAPYTPVTFGTFAGHNRGALFEPIRKTPIHDWAAAKGATFEDVGQWKRAWYFPQPGENMHRAITRECRAVRTGVGLFDASTLGKIEVVGPDAAEFMNRLYTNSWTKLEPGRCRYGLMLNEQGFVMDDGVVGRLAPDRFHVTTTTGGAARVLAHMEDYLQTEFGDLKVWLTSTTEQWAVIAVQGPKARATISGLIEGIDLGAMPHMSVRTGTVAGVSARLFRVSFTGELGYEINVPAAHGRAVWDAVWTAGQPHGITAYGTESMHVLRAEKGFIIVGQETDGTVTPHDLGLNGMVGKAKPDFVGKRSLARPDIVKADRKQLVGLLTVDPAIVLEEGAQITELPNPTPGTPALGHVTSSYHSPTLNRSIALALVVAGRARRGATLHVPMPTGAVAVHVVDPVFVDPEGTHLHVS